MNKFRCQASYGLRVGESDCRGSLTRFLFTWKQQGDMPPANVFCHDSWVARAKGAKPTRVGYVYSCFHHIPNTVKWVERIADLEQPISLEERSRCPACAGVGDGQDLKEAPQTGINEDGGTWMAQECSTCKNAGSVP